jgi:hypothetical protein
MLRYKTRPPLAARRIALLLCAVQGGPGGPVPGRLRATCAKGVPERRGVGETAASGRGLPGLNSIENRDVPRRPPRELLKAGMEHTT